MLQITQSGNTSSYLFGYSMGMDSLYTSYLITLWVRQQQTPQGTTLWNPWCDTILVLTLSTRRLFHTSDRQIMTPPDPPPPPPLPIVPWRARPPIRSRGGSGQPGVRVGRWESPGDAQDIGPSQTWLNPTKKIDHVNNGNGHGARLKSNTAGRCAWWPRRWSAYLLQ